MMYVTSGDEFRAQLDLRQRLDAAELTHTEARTAREKAEALQDRTRAELTKLDQRIADLGKRIAALTVAVALEHEREGTLRGVEAEHDAALRQRDKARALVAALDPKIVEARKHESAAHHGLLDAMGRFARPAYEHLRTEAREAYRAAARAQRRWLILARSVEERGGCCYSGQIYTQLGAQGSPDSLDAVCIEAGITPGGAPHHARPLERLTLDELRSLVDRTLDT